MDVHFSFHLVGQSDKGYDKCLAALQAAMEVIRSNGMSFELRELKIGTEQRNTRGKKATGWTPERQTAANTALRVYIPSMTGHKMAHVLGVSETTITRLNIGTLLGSKAIEQLIKGLKKLETPAELISKFRCMIENSDES